MLPNPHRTVSGYPRFDPNLMNYTFPRLQYSKTPDAVPNGKDAFKVGITHCLFHSLIVLQPKWEYHPPTVVQSLV